MNDLLEKTNLKWKIIEVDTDLSKTYNDLKQQDVKMKKRIIQFHSSSKISRNSFLMLK